MPHRIRKMREAIVAQNSAATAQSQSNNPVLLDLETQLRADQAELKSIISVSHKHFAKKDKVPKYWHYVSSIISKDVAINDNIVRIMLVWSADAMLFDEFIQIARYMVKFNIPMPGGFTVPLTTFITDSAKTMIAHEENEQFKAITATKAEEIYQIVNAIEAPEMKPYDQSYAKFLKELGRKVEALQSKSGLTRAKGYYEEALSLDSNIGVKQDLKRIEKQLEEAPQ